VVIGLENLSKGAFPQLFHYLESISNVIIQFTDVLSLIIVKAIVIYTIWGLWSPIPFPLQEVQVVHSVIIENFNFFEVQKEFVQSQEDLPWLHRETDFALLALVQTLVSSYRVQSGHPWTPLRRNPLSCINTVVVVAFSFPFGDGGDVLVYSILLLHGEHKLVPSLAQAVVNLVVTLVLVRKIYGPFHINTLIRLFVLTILFQLNFNFNLLIMLGRMLASIILRSFSYEHLLDLLQSCGVLLGRPSNSVERSRVFGQEISISKAILFHNFKVIVVILIDVVGEVLNLLDVLDNLRGVLANLQRLHI